VRLAVHHLKCALLFFFVILFLFNAFPVPALAAAETRSSYLSNPSDGSTVNNFLTYKNPTYGFSIHYPSNWNFKEFNQKLPLSTMIVEFYNSLLSEAHPHSLSLKRTVYLTIYVENTTSVATTIANLKSDFGHFKLISINTTFPFAGNSGYEISWTSAYKGNPFQDLEIGTNVHGRQYLVFYDALAANYDTYLPTIQKMIESFELAATSQPTGQSHRFATNETTSFLSYENPAVGIKIQYPSTWTKNETPVNSVRFVAPQQNASAKYLATVDIFVYPQAVRGNLTLNQTVNGLLNSRHTLPNFTLLYSIPTNLVNGSVPAHVLVYTYNYPSVGLIKAIDTVMIVGSKTYLVSYNGESAMYGYYLPTIEKMVNSITFIPPSALQ
jgi:hypothetical protein